ncbi:MAG: YkgJ family cysteine cluster protein [Ignavibacteriaceae bacterium]
MNKLDIPKRKKYNDERKYSWLPILLDSYSINDFEIGLEVRREEQRKQSKIACHKGCSNCCKKTMVPISHLELRGISWYTSEVLDFEIQEKIKVNISNSQNTTVCPFLVDDVCSIYAVRPLACRSFYVFNKVCELDEEPNKTRPDDIFAPNPSIGKKVAMRFLDDDLYNLKTKKEKEEAFNNHIMMKTARFMHNIDWNDLLKVIIEFQKIRFNN